MLRFLASTWVGCRRVFPRRLLHKLATHKISTILLLIGQVLICQELAIADDNRPNIIVIMADDLGYGDLSCYGNTAFKTPHLDALAANGMKFTDFHSSGAVCSPTRAGLMTGRYQQRAGIPGVVFADPKRKEHKHGLQAIENTFAELLLAEGYSTAMFGKWHLGYETQYNPTKNGFEEFRGYVSGNVDYFSHVDQAGNFDWWINDKKQDEEGYSTHLITNHAVRFIEKSDDRPFCLYVAHEAPHYPYQGPNDKAVRKVGAPRNRKENQGVNIKQAYREMVQSVDTGVGEIVAAVEKKGLTDETLIMFFSDNGATKSGSNGRFRGHKGSVWEGGHRVPFIASWPSRIKAGTTQDQLAITLDIMPTMLDLAGISLPTNRRLDGKSLVTALGGGSLEARTLYWEHGKNLATRRGEWKLVKRGEKAAELYNLEQDPEESSDIAAKNVKRTIGMLQMLLRWKAATMQGATVQPN